MKPAPCTAEHLRELLDYDPYTGLFRWKIASKQTPWLSGQVAGFIEQQGYWIIVIDRQIYKAHRLAWLYVYGEWPKNQIDHVNGNRSDNRLENLRAATQAQNQQNVGLTRRNNSGYKGVHWKSSHKKWCAQIRRDGHRVNLGHFDTAELAAAAYEQASKQMHGDFAFSNRRLPSSRLQ